MVDNPSRLPQARLVETVQAAQAGYIAEVSALKIAQAAFDLGAGREKKGDPIDLAVGIEVHVNVGDQVEPGAPLATIHADDETKLAASRVQIEDAIRYSAGPVEPLPLFYDTIYGQ
jgi:pyrimidine-nucleoside phosphorylase